MWKYVSRRVKDTIELGINARKAFSLNQINHEESQQRKQQQQSDEKCYKVVPRLQDPSSRDQHNKRDEKFKRKYQRLTLNQRQFLSILTWVSFWALVKLQDGLDFKIWFSSFSSCLQISQFDTQNLSSRQRLCQDSTLHSCFASIVAIIATLSTVHAASTPSI